MISSTNIFHQIFTGALIAPIRLEDILYIIQLLVKDLPECKQLLQVTPQFLRQQDSYDRVLCILTHLIYLVVNLKPDDGDMECQRLIHQIVHTMDPRTASGNDLQNLNYVDYPSDRIPTHLMSSHKWNRTDPV